MPIDPSKVVLASVIASGLGVVSYGSYEILREKTIFETMRDSKKSPLKTDSNEQDELWTKIIKAYNEEKNSKNRVEGWDIKAGDENLEANKNEIKKKCSFLYKEMYSEENLKNASNWCIKESEMI